MFRYNSSSQMQGSIDSKIKSYQIQRGYLLLFIFLSASQLSLTSRYRNIHLLHHQVVEPRPRPLVVLRTSARIVAPLDRPQAIELLRRSLGDSGRAALVIVSLSECSVTVSNLISSEYLVDNGCAHLPSVNFSYRRVIRVPC